MCQYQLDTHFIHSVANITPQSETLFELEAASMVGRYSLKRDRVLWVI